MKNTLITTLTIAAALAFSTHAALASGTHGDHGKPAAAPAAASAPAAKDMTEAEVRKVDADNSKITLKHGYIKSIDMPGMTMVFTAKDKAMLDGLAVGDKVQFALETVGGKFTITEIQKK